MKEFSIKLDEAQLNYISGVLGKQPYMEVAQLVQVIAQQLQQQQTPPLPANLPNGAAAAPPVQ